MVNGNNINVDLKQTRIQKDEKVLLNLIQSWVNPFVISNSLMNISTARGAPPEYSHRSKESMKSRRHFSANFKIERLESNPQIETFHDQIKLNKLKTFSNLSKEKEIRSRSVILQADRAIFSRIIGMGQNRNLHKAEVLSHPVGPLL